MSQPFTDTAQSFSQALSAEEIAAGEFEFNLRFLGEAARYSEGDGGAYRFAFTDGIRFLSEISSTFPPRVRSDELKRAFAKCQLRSGQRVTVSFSSPSSITLGLEEGEILTVGRVREPMKNSDTRSNVPLNMIFFGPPGTGKTFKTADAAVKICDGECSASRQETMERYKELEKEGRLRFVTFHQSYGYEDFVEGLRPESKDGQISYRVRPGIFREACDAARLSTFIKPGLSGKPLKERTIYKMSLGIAGSNEGKQAFQECIKGDFVLLGWGQDIDFSDCTGLDQIAKRIEEINKEIEKPESQARYVKVFKEDLQVGDIVIASQGNRAFRAIGEVTGEYDYREEAVAGRYHQIRAVRWLAVFDGNRSVADIYDRAFMQQAIYKLSPDSVNHEALEGLLRGSEAAGPRPFVLIIDEINRANISKVFGELITLLEPDKREGELNALTVRLPYSGDEFSVPANLHVVGTMNTADRSIALLDTALRRRFDFEELRPDYSALPEGLVDGVDLRAILMAMNDRIEYLYDRDHTIGHAYFIHVSNLSELEAAFRRRVIPLLQEYFYEDWSKIISVLRDAKGEFVDVQRELPRGLDFSSEGFDGKLRYRVRSEPFPVDAYIRIYE